MSTIRSDWGPEGERVSIKKSMPYPRRVIFTSWGGSTYRMDVDALLGAIYKEFPNRRPDSRQEAVNEALEDAADGVGEAVVEVPVRLKITLVTDD